MHEENYGKRFEDAIRKSFAASAGTSVIRLHDQMSGFKGSTNIADFLVYHQPNLYIIECKSVRGPRFSIHSNDSKHAFGRITNTQWQGMSEQAEIPGVHAGIMLWFIDHDITRYIPIAALQFLRDNNIKSIRYDDCKELGVDVPGHKKRTFFAYDMDEFFANVKKGDD